MILRRVVPPLLLMMLLLGSPGLAFAEADPVFSDGGPDAAGFGQAENYPVGRPQDAGRQGNLVGAYTHYDALLPGHQVSRGASVSSYSRAPAELVLPYAYNGGSHDLADYLARQPATGLLIARDRTILFEHYQYARTARDRFTSQSMAKTVLGMLVGIAVGDGRIHSLEDNASVYVPELADTPVGNTPIGALLTMTSGLAFTEVYNGRDDMARMGRELRLGTVGGVSVNATLATLKLFDQRVAPPGTLFHYSSLDSEVLGLVLRRATGVPVSDYLASRVWQPMGAEADASWNTDAADHERTYCCVNAVLRDWARFGLLLANDGAVNGKQVIPKQWVLDATTAAASSSILAPRRATRFFGYGYQTWILPGARRQFALMGVHGQVILVDPVSKLVLVNTAVRPQARDPMAQELLALWDALVAQEGK